MNNIKNKLTIFLSSVLMLIAYGTAAAKCNKEDINYYLEKGFTTEQVTALCSENISTSKKTEEIYRSFSDEYADEQDEDYIRKMRIERQVFFKSALGAQNIKLKRDHLIFDQYQCAKDGFAKPGSDRNFKGCAVVLTKIKLSEIEVDEKEFKEKVFFGARSIRVKGNVTTKITGGMEGLSEYDAKVLNDKVLARLAKNKGETYIPIKQGLNFSYALETFKEIVAFHKELANKRNLNNNLGGKLDVHDLNVETQNEYIIEKESNEIRLSNDIDDSIDGTLVFDDLPSSNTDINKNNDIPDDVFN